jgi:phenylacetate-CoA ligase
VKVKIGLRDGYTDAVVKELKDSFRSRIRVAPEVVVLPVEEIQRINFPAKSRKPIKFIDLRAKH